MVNTFSQQKTKMLIGEYTHTLDDKNRVSLPAKFRTEMGKKIVVTAGLDGCLFIFTMKGWESFSENLGGDSSTFKTDARSFNRYILGSAQEIEVDSLGRILIPDYLKERSNLKNKVVVIGVQNRAEIWNEKVWNEYKKVVEKQADALAEKFGQAGVL